MKNFGSHLVLFLLLVWGVGLAWLGMSLSLEENSMPFDNFVAAILAGIVSGIIVAHLTGDSIQARFLKKRNDDRLKQVKRFFEEDDYSKRDCDRNIRILEGLDEYLHADSQYYLGILYLYGNKKYIRKNRKKARNLLEKAHRSGHLDAEIAIARMDSKGA